MGIGGQRSSKGISSFAPGRRKETAVSEKKQGEIPKEIF